MTSLKTLSGSWSEEKGQKQELVATADLSPYPEIWNLREGSLEITKSNTNIFSICCTNEEGGRLSVGLLHSI